MINFKKVWEGLRIKGKTTLNSDTLGELEVSSTDSKLYFHDGSVRSPILTEASAATITNKDLVDTTTNIVDSVDATKRINFDAAGTTGTRTTIASSQTTNKTLTLPDATDTLVAKNTTDTLTNKTLTAPVIATIVNTGTLTLPTSTDTLVGRATTDTLTNKTIDANGTGNSISNLETADLAAGVLNTSTSLTGATNSQIPSALAAKTYTDNKVAAVQSEVDNLVTLTGVAANSTDLGTFTGTTIPDGSTIKSALQSIETAFEASGSGNVSGPGSATDNAVTRFDGTTGKLIQNSTVTIDDTGVVAGASIDTATNTITGIANTNIATGAAIARSKLASGTNSAVVFNNGSGVMTDSSDLTVGTNSLTLANTKHIEKQAQTDSTTTGSNASLAAFTAGGVRITNGSLVSLANIPAGANGQEFVLFNRTGVSVSIVDSSGAVGTAANRILTGTGANITLAADSALFLSYDSTTARWQVIGGSGSGSGVATSAVDNVFNINDAGDATKQINFDAGGTTSTKTTIAAAQTANRTVTLPDATTTLVGTDTTQTLTNKSLVDTSTSIVDSGDATKKILFDAGGTTATTTTITAAQTASRVLTLPDATDTLTANAATQTLTNKTIVAANNTITTASSGNLAATSLNAALAELQSDIDTRFKQPNYISANPDAEIGTTGWAAYADAAGTAPVDGTGGSPVVTITRTTSAPLRGTGSFLITKDAANRQGNGVSFDFTIDSADTTKVLQCTFDYSIASGTYADSDITMWIYDVTNGAVIQPAPSSLKNTTINDKMFLEFQTTTSTSYRLIFHIASTSASAYTVKFDNVNLGPQGKLYGSAQTDWVAYTPTFTGFGTPTNVNFFYRRSGADLFLKGIWTNGTTTATEFRISLPTGLSIATLQDNPSAASGTPVGLMHANSSNANNAGLVVLADSGNAYVTFGVLSAGSPGLGNTSSTAQVVTGVQQSLWAGPINITGWGSSQVMSNDADTRVVDFVGTVTSTTALTAAVTNVPLTSSKDSHSAWNGTQYVVPVPGDYFIQSAITLTTGSPMILAYINGTAAGNLGFTTTNQVCSGSILLPNLKAGDLISFRTGSSGQTANTDANNKTSITKISGPSQVLSSESVNMRYFASATSISGSLATISHTTKDFDSHNAYSAGTFTVPVAGKYQVNAALDISGTFALNSTANIQIQKNGTVVSETLIKAGGAETSVPVACSDIISCIAGDTIRVQALSSATTPTITSSNSKNFLSIFRAGN